MSKKYWFDKQYHHLSLHNLQKNSVERAEFIDRWKPLRASAVLRDEIQTIRFGETVSDL
jgi:hypothetical protein